MLGVDTIVALGSRIYGKPADRERAAQALTALAGRTHVVVSGVCVIEPGRSRTAARDTVFGSDRCRGDTRVVPRQRGVARSRRRLCDPGARRRPRRRDRRRLHECRRPTRRHPARIVSRPHRDTGFTAIFQRRRGRRRSVATRRPLHSLRTGPAARCALPPVTSARPAATLPSSSHGLFHVPDRVSAAATWPSTSAPPTHSCTSAAGGSCFLSRASWRSTRGPARCTRSGSRPSGCSAARRGRSPRSGP